MTPHEGRGFRVLALFLFAASLANAQNQDGPGGELILRAFQSTFPDKTGDLAFQDGDWTIRAGNETFYWAGGRLLPAAERRQFASYSPHPFDFYPAVTPSPAIYSAPYIEALRQRGSDEALRNRKPLHSGFTGILYGGVTRGEIERRLVPTQFLGKKVTVHRDIVEALRRIEAEIRKTARAEAARGNAGLSAFIASIGQIGGYNWRDIHGTRQMSYHSWGLAVDIQPAKLAGQAIYWLWERSRNENWMLIPLEQRWKPPDQVIEAFEREGFIWGGKWPLYDNMHFEYRPELHELNRLVMGLLAAETENPPPDQPPPNPGLKQKLAAFFARLRARW